jgi:cytochrome b involved in lipid metabolism
MTDLVQTNLKQFLPVHTPKQRYFIAEEICHHNTANDCLIMLFGEVYDLTKTVQYNIENPLTTPLREAAGTDITYWFDYSSREPRVKVNCQTGDR